MGIYDRWYVRVYEAVASTLAKITFKNVRALFTGRTYNLTAGDWTCLQALLARSYYIILTDHRTNVSSFLIKILCFLKTLKWPRYTHVLMNVDGADSSVDWTKFKFVEAVGVGVKYSTFAEVFDCDAVCLLRPKALTREEWNQILDGVKSEIGKPYDDLFDLLDDTHVSCVELVRDLLSRDPDYIFKFADFEDAIKKVGNLTPQMFRDCRDFEVAYEIVR